MCIYVYILGENWASPPALFVTFCVFRTFLDVFVTPASPRELDIGDMGWVDDCLRFTAKKKAVGP